jgi:hypothetical protein
LSAPQELERLREWQEVLKKVEADKLREEQDGRLKVGGWGRWTPGLCSCAPASKSCVTLTANLACF